MPIEAFRTVTDEMLTASAFTLAGKLTVTPAADIPLDKLKLPPGFEIALFARVPNARQMALGKNTLFVGSMRAGKVYAIPLKGSRKPLVIADGLTMPVGVAFRDGDLYVSAVSRIGFRSHPPSPQPRRPGPSSARRPTWPWPFCARRLRGRRV